MASFPGRSSPCRWPSTRFCNSVARPFHPGYLLAVCWIGVYVILFSLARTKLPSYVTPCYPALALLVGDYIDRWSRQAAAVGGRLARRRLRLPRSGRNWHRRRDSLVAKQYLPGEEWLGLIGLVPIVGCVACIGFVAVRSYFAAAGSLAMTAVAFATLLFAVGIERVDRHQTNHVLCRRSTPARPSPDRLVPRLGAQLGLLRQLSVHEFIDDKRLPPGHHRRRGHRSFLTQSPDHFLITTQRQIP